MLSILNIYCQNDWKEYRYEDYNFKIKFIQDPETTADSSIFNDSTLVTYNWTVNVLDTTHENTYYSINTVAFPSYYIHSDSLLSVVEGFLNSSQDGIRSDNTFTLLSSSLIEKQGYPGKSFKWKNNSNNVFFEFEVFLVKNALYLLSVVSKEGNNHNIFINGYFDNFQIINIPNGNFTLANFSNKQTYSIEFPGQTLDQNKMMDSEIGKLEINIKSYEPKNSNENLVYVGMETKYPTNSINQNDTYALNSFYKKAIDGSLASVNGELISINDIFYDGKLGKEYKCYFKAGKILMVYRIFYINDYVYSFGVLTLPERDNNNSMKRFFDSFKIKQ